MPKFLSKNRFFFLIGPSRKATSLHLIISLKMGEFNHFEHKQRDIQSMHFWYYKYKIQDHFSFPRSQLLSNHSFSYLPQFPKTCLRLPISFN